MCLWLCDNTVIGGIAEWLDVSNRATHEESYWLGLRQHTSTVGLRGHRHCALKAKLPGRKYDTLCVMHSYTHVVHDTVVSQIRQLLTCTLY